MAAPDPHVLTPYLGAEVAAAIWRAAGREAPDDVGRLFAKLAGSPGVHLETIGSSSAGTPITMLQLGAGSRPILAYAYVHPDEPLGARALAGLAQEWVEGEVLRQLDITWHLIACADPDIAAWNRRWAMGDDLADFIYGTIRPEHLAREVDYGFPVDHGIFLQPDDYDGARACWSAGRCVRPGSCGAECGRLRLPAGPLPESRAIARAIRQVKPDLVVSLHDTHTGGLFSFLRHRPDARMIDALTTATAHASGIPRHMGQRIDSGRPWTRMTPDLIREPDLASEARRFLRRTGADPALRYHGNVSAAQYLESIAPHAGFLVPEAPHFTHPDFGDTDPLDEEWDVTGLIRRTRQGDRYVIVGTLVHPDGIEEEVLYRMRTDADGPLGPHRRAVTVGMLGAEAVARRRHALAGADAIWLALPDAVRNDPAHPFAAERRMIHVPAARVNDASLRYFRLAGGYDRLATRAHAADFRWRWSIHTAQRLGSFARFLTDVGGHTASCATLEAAVDDHIAPLPQELQRTHDRRAAAFSQLARIMLVAKSQRGDAR